MRDLNIAYGNSCMAKRWSNKTTSWEALGERLKTTIRTTESVEEYRGKGYARILLKSMLSKARELGFETVSLTTKPSVMPIAYGLYGRMGFRELSEDAGTVRMAKDLQIE